MSLVVLFLICLVIIAAFSEFSFSVSLLMAVIITMSYLFVSIVGGTVALLICVIANIIIQVYKNNERKKNGIVSKTN